MSYCRKEGKDTIIFCTEEFLSTPSKTKLLPDDPSEVDTSNAGAILPDGSINWDCPCLGNLPNGPCGPSFRESFQCWVEYRDDEKDFAEKCYDKFISWEGCLSQHKAIYRPEEQDSKASTSDNNKAEPAPISNDTSPVEDINNNNNNNNSSVLVDNTKTIAVASVTEDQE